MRDEEGKRPGLHALKKKACDGGRSVGGEPEKKLDHRNL